MNGKTKNCSWLEIHLYATALLFFLGHLVNFLFSPKPLNPFWNMISQYAASSYGGFLVTLGIVMFGLAEMHLALSFFFQKTHRWPWPVYLSSLLLVAGTIPMIMIGVYPTFRPDENRGTDFLGTVSAVLQPKNRPTLVEIANDHWHNVGSALAFPFLLIALFLIGYAFFKSVQFKGLGIWAMLMVPVICILLGMAYTSLPFNGSWQRLVFLFSLTWMIATARRLRLTGAVSRSNRLQG